MLFRNTVIYHVIKFLYWLTYIIDFHFPKKCSGKRLFSLIIDRKSNFRPECQFSWIDARIRGGKYFVFLFILGNLVSRFAIVLLKFQLCCWRADRYSNSWIDPVFRSSTSPVDPNSERKILRFAWLIVRNAISIAIYVLFHVFRCIIFFNHFRCSEASISRYCSICLKTSIIHQYFKYSEAPIIYRYFRCPEASIFYYYTCCEGFFGECCFYFQSWLM